MGSLPFPGAEHQGACPWGGAHGWYPHITGLGHMASQVHWSAQVDRISNASSIMDARAW